MRQRSDNPPKRPPHLPLLDLLDGRQSLYPVRCAGSSRHRTSYGPIIGTGAAHELYLAGAVVSSLVAPVLWHTLYHAAGHRAGTAREGPTLLRRPLVERHLTMSLDTNQLAMPLAPTPRGVQVFGKHHRCGETIILIKIYMHLEHTQHAAASRHDPIRPPQPPPMCPHLRGGAI